MVIVLHHLCDVSVEQIASETGAPVGTVKARLHRGRAALAKHLVVDEVDETDVPARKESGRVG
jgi:RNA polymerase sigma-70 factor (ECF subfamily)